MNREDVLFELAKLDEMGLNRDRYSVSGKAAMVLWGIIDDCNHIDILTQSGANSRLRELGYDLTTIPGSHRCGFNISDTITGFRRPRAYRHYSSLRINGYKVIRPSGLCWATISHDNERGEIDLESRERILIWMRENECRNKYVAEWIDEQLEEIHNGTVEIY